jgi:hypothetical protein
MPRRTSLPRGRHTGGAPDPVHAGTGERQPFVLGQQLGEVMLVEAGVPGLG